VLPPSIKSAVDTEILRIGERLAEQQNIVGAHGMMRSSLDTDYLKAIGGDQADDVLTQIVPLEQTRVGHILDAQDYLGQWYLGVVIGGSGAERVIHFLPFKNAKRDENYHAASDQHKIAAAFSHSEKFDEPAKAISTLKDYLKSI